MSKPIYLVRGSGTKLDGTMVQLTEATELDGQRFFSCHPAGALVKSEYPILVHEKHLQELDTRLKRYTYSITVSKKCLDDGTMEQDFIVIDSAIRNMGVKTILTKLDAELGPILRAE